MKLILKEDIGRLGRFGDEVSVADGYGRNFLIPKGMALPATPENRRTMKEQMKYVRRRLDKTRGDAEALKQRIESTPCRFTRKVGEGDRLFGSVTSKEIAEELERAGIEFDRRKIELDQPVKSLGTVQVSIRLHPDVTAQVSVTVEREASAAPEGTGETPQADPPAQG